MPWPSSHLKAFWVLGHSLGGLAFAFRRHDVLVERIPTVGAGFGHVSDRPWSCRPLALAFWYAVGPLGTALAGYLPGKRLLLGEDMPAGICACSALSVDAALAGAGSRFAPRLAAESRGALSTGRDVRPRVARAGF